jgi:PAS domain S-box-containing protein
MPAAANNNESFDIEELRLRLEEAEQALEAIRTGQVESLVLEGPDGPRIFSLEGATQSYRVLVEAMNEGAVTSTETGTVLYCNGRFAGMVGLPLERVIGSSMREHVAERSRPGFDRLLERALGTGAREELPLRACDGHELPAYLSVSSIIDDGRRVFCIVATDLREQKRNEALAAAERTARESEQRLREADRRKDEFLGMLSHELRNPLAPIRNSNYILRHAAPGSDQARRAQMVIERQTKHLARIVDDLLDVARVARGKIELLRRRIDLQDVLRRAAEDFRSIMEDRGLVFRTVFPDGKLWADADDTRLTQVIGNLLHNAAKFTRRDGEVTLSVAARRTDAEIRVRDTGVGIEPALLPHLFEAFVQGERTIVRSDGGLGLGLALVKGIVELHGGTVRAESQGVGHGAEFVLQLPLAEAEVMESGGTAGIARAARARRVLVVDDNVDAAESLAEILRMSGHEVETVFDGPGALEKVRNSRPDVVLCDIGLPGMSGYEVARVLRSEGGNGTRLFAVSGYALPEDVTKAIDSGFDGHITKPCDPEELERLLA